MIDVSNYHFEDAGKLVLRASLAILILFHGVAKLTGGADFVTAVLEQAGLPHAIGYLVYVGELLAPLLVLFGIWTRVAAFIIAGNMIIAVALVHLGQLFMLNKHGGWELEVQGLYFAAAAAVTLLGAGRYSVGGAAGKWN